MGIANIFVQWVVSRRYQNQEKKGYSVSQAKLNIACKAKQTWVIPEMQKKLLFLFPMNV